VKNFADLRGGSPPTETDELFTGSEGPPLCERTRAPVQQLVSIGDARRAAKIPVARGDDTADIFSRDGWKELPDVGTYVGRERIRQSLKMRHPNGTSPDVLALHQVVQPVIHVSADARSARIRGRLFQLGGPAGGEGSSEGDMDLEDLRELRAVLRALPGSRAVSITPARGRAS
jgi:hypothetical protein